MPARFTSLLSASLLITSFSLQAQVMDHSSVLTGSNDSSWFKFNYDNDYFTKMDHYYTQGITLEYAAPFLRQSPVTRLLVRPHGTDKQFGLSVHHLAYTPDNTNSDGIVYGDRPFTAILSLESFVIATDSRHHTRVVSSLSLGFMGPAAFGEQMQVGIHKWLKNKLPRGWGNQLHNDILLNYQVNYEKSVYSNHHNLLINGTAGLRAGTVNDALTGGLNLRLGHFNEDRKRTWQYYFYAQPQFHLVAYDATLQGGLFNRSSPYTIPAADISRGVLQADAGVVVNCKKLYLSYSQSVITKEFSTGDYHRWGGVSLCVAF